MARVIVQYPIDVAVIVDGREAGRTNRPIPATAGAHTITLAGEATEPASLDLVLDALDDPIVWCRFSPSEVPLDRFSPLYCLYNGVLLGQFLSLSFASYGRKDYPVRRARMAEFLAEIAVDVEVPRDPPELGSDEHLTFMQALLTGTASRSATLADFVLFGGTAAHWGVLATSDPITAAQNRDECERLRVKHGLPALDYDAMILPGPGASVDAVLSPFLLYLARAVDAMEVEPRTAFVIMPFKPPYSGYFSELYRPSLEQAGFRAFRAWGGLATEDYCDLLLKLIAKSGLVWADVSERNDNVLYEIGAAHALGKLGMLVVRTDLATSTPANIGHDAVVRYDPGSADWPHGTIRLMATLLSVLELAVERGERIRVTPDALSATLEHVGEQLAATLVPPEARTARQDGQQKLAVHDYEGAARAFDEALTLGLDDVQTYLGRGLARYGLGAYPEAESDLDRYLAAPESLPEAWGDAAYFRGLAREQQGRLTDASEDYALAIAHGYGDSDAEVFRRLATVRIGAGQFDAAAAAMASARAADPHHPDNGALDGDLQLAQGHYTEAIAAYDEVLARGSSFEAACNRALALLLAGRQDEAAEAYRAAARDASEIDRGWALGELRARAAGRPGFTACEAALRSTDVAPQGT